MYPTREELLQHEVKVLNQGRFANATVRLCRIGEADWVMKDVARKPRVVRLLYIRPVMRRELKALNKLRGMNGVPQDAYRVDRDAIAYRHIPGQVLARVQAGELAPGFFPALEELVEGMHRNRLVHLDIRYIHNVLVREDGTPAIIDFQTALSLPSWPKWLSAFMRGIDTSGVYKHWLKRSPETMDEARRARLAELSKWRKYWVFTGYFGRRTRERKRKQKQAARAIAP